MKILIICLFAFLSTNSCNKKTEITENINNNKMNKTAYFLNFDLGGNYEIYVNGINLLYRNDNTISHGYEYLNPLILKEGKQSIMMKYKPFSKEVKITPNNVEEIFLEIYSSDNGENPPFKLVKRLSFSPISEPVDSLFQTWEFDAKVNYQNNELDNALAIDKINISKLNQEVVSRYQEIRNIINTGNSKEYKKLFENSLTREAKSMYYTEEETQNYILEQIERASKAKETMLPFVNYSLKIHPNNKTIELIDNEGKSPLISIDKEGYTRIFGFYLYKDKTTGELKVF